MYAYVDETGNTGQNIFDEAQPHYLTAALVTRTNFDVLNRRSIQALAERLNEHTLHASELGPLKIDELSDDLLRILKKSKARFIFSNLEKHYLAMTKIVDHVFDSGENLSVPWHVYSLRPLRLLLLFRLAPIVDVPLAKDFWESLMEPEKNAASRKYVAACRELLARVAYLPDARTVELASEALQWAIDNPEAIHLHSGSKQSRYGHLPNAVAFINLMQGLHAQSKRWHRPLKLIVHDEQMQFEKTFEKWHELYSNASAEPFNWPGDEARVLQLVPGSTFMMSKDDDSPGVQVIDILLWLFRRMINEKEMGTTSAALLDFSLSPAPGIRTSRLSMCLASYATICRRSM